MTETDKDKHARQSFLERRMVEKDFNMKSLSLAAGLGATAVRDILTRRNSRPSGDVWVKLAAVLECDLMALMADFTQAAPKAPAPASSPQLSPQEQAMLELFRQLPPEERSRVMKVASAFAQPADDEQSKSGTGG